MGYYNFIFEFIIVFYILEEIGCSMVYIFIMISYLIWYLFFIGNVIYVNGKWIICML